MRVTSLAPVPCRNVLLVTSNPNLREHLLHAVREMAFDVACVGSLTSAVRLQSERGYDILVVDAAWPGGTDELFRQVRELSHAPAQIEFGTRARPQQFRSSAQSFDPVERLFEPCSMRDLELALDRARRRRQSQMPCRSLDGGPDADEFEESTMDQQQTIETDHGQWMSLEEIERKHILATLEKYHGNRALTASALGISLRKLYYRLGQYQREGQLQR